MNETNSYFDGGLLQYIGWRILGNLITILTLGICLPWAYCMIYSWEAKHTVIEGKRIYFDGTAIQLFGNWLKWWFLTIITLGIYGFWVFIKLKQWRVKHTFFDDGTKIPKPTMDKTDIAIVVGIMVLVLVPLSVGISNAYTKSIPKNENKMTSSEIDNKNKVENISYGIGDKITTDKIEFTVVSVDKKKAVSTDESGYLSYTAEGNNVYYLVKVKVKNISKESVSIDSSSFKLKNKDVEYSPSTLFTDKAMNFDGLNPGTEVEKTLYYSIPKNADLSNCELISQDNIFSEIGYMKIKLKDVKVTEKDAQKKEVIYVKENDNSKEEKKSRSATEHNRDLTSEYPYGDPRNNASYSEGEYIPEWDNSKNGTNIDDPALNDNHYDPNDPTTYE